MRLDVISSLCVSTKIIIVLGRMSCIRILVQVAELFFNILVIYFLCSVSFVVYDGLIT